eukprot:5918460-Amphidinium_carterae.1
MAYVTIAKLLYRFLKPRSHSGFNDAEGYVLAVSAHVSTEQISFESYPPHPSQNEINPRSEPGRGAERQR